MDMQQMLELLLANQGEMKADGIADREREMSHVTC
jgi:hypothetical protein